VSEITSDQQPKSPSPYRSIALRWWLVLPVAAQLLGTIGAIGWLSWYHHQQTSATVGNQLRQETSLRISDYLTHRLSAPRHVVQLMAMDSQAGRVNWRDRRDRERRLRDYFSVLDGAVDNLAYGDRNGEFTAVERSPDRQSRQLQVADPQTTAGLMQRFSLDQRRLPLPQAQRLFDPRSRSWYRSTVATGTLTWNPVFPLHAAPQVLALPISQPLRDRQGQVVGVVTSRLYLSAFSQFLAELPIGRSGLAFVMERNGYLIATSTNQSLFRTASGRNQPVDRLRAEDAANPAIRAAARYLRQPPPTNASPAIVPAATGLAPQGWSTPAQPQQQFVISTARGNYLGQVTNIRQPGLDWQLVVLIPDRDLQHFSHSQLQAIFGVGGFMLVAVIVGGGWIVRRLSRPIQRLVQAAESVAAGNWHDRVPRSPIRELDRLAATFNCTIEQLAQSFQTLAHQARHDPLTNLPNRYSFLQAIAQCWASHPASHQSPGAILFLDLDDFKWINDSLGHWAGDQLLQLVAEQLQAQLLPEHLLAHFGGDEFAILLPTVPPGDGGKTCAMQLQTALSQPFNLGGVEAFTRASIGITQIDPNFEPEALLRQAEIALYAAKQRGKSAYVWFSPDMHAQVVAHFQLASDLQRALARGELVLHYQPILTLETQQIRGFEALMRWHHPQRGSVSPSEFVPIAEETGIIIELGWWALREACQQLQIWRHRYDWCAEAVMAVNCSIRQLSVANFVARVEAILQETGLPATALALEITESLLLNLSPELRSTLDRLAILGVRWMIDDFGTGYSSLSYLHQLPLYGLKIDRSFIHSFDRQERARTIVAAIVNLGTQLGLQTTAEGVETTASIQLLQQMGCNAVQGFFYSPPTAPATLESWMLAWQQRIQPLRKKAVLTLLNSNSHPPNSHSASAHPALATGDPAHAIEADTLRSPHSLPVESPQGLVVNAESPDNHTPAGNGSNGSKGTTPATNRTLIDTIYRTLNYIAERPDPIDRT
jgi:diguanylate cyclase (GGDEF)-like protein